MHTVEQILMVKGPDVIVALPSTTVREAARLMAEDNVGSIIIRDQDGVKGIFTERDLLRRVVARGKDPRTTCLEDVMSSPVSSCHLEDDVRECARIFSEKHIRHLAVVEEESVLGLIGLRDIQTAIIQDEEQKIERLMHLYYKA